MEEAVFQPVSGGRVSSEIVEQVKHAIRAGQLGLGDRLPPERELTALFGVSRVTVRDALRVLEANGLVKIRVGAGGGAFVTAPDSGDLGEGITNMLLMRSVSPQDVTETRMILEIGMLPLVCQRATSTDLEALEAICNQAEAAIAEGTDYDVALSADFHHTLAMAAHNKVIALLIEPLHTPLEASLEAAKARAPEMGIEGTAEHRKLVKAIRERNPEQAQSIMQRHLNRTAKRLRTRR